MEIKFCKGRVGLSCLDHRDKFPLTAHVGRFPNKATVNNLHVLLLIVHMIAENRTWIATMSGSDPTIPDITEV